MDERPVGALDVATLGEAEAVRRPPPGTVIGHSPEERLRPDAALGHRLQVVAQNRLQVVAAPRPVAADRLVRPAGWW